MVIIKIVYNVMEDCIDNVDDINLKRIINKKLLNIIMFMETCVLDID